MKLTKKDYRALLFYKQNGYFTKKSLREHMISKKNDDHYYDCYMCCKNDEKDIVYRFPHHEDDRFYFIICEKCIEKYKDYAVDELMQVINASSTTSGNINRFLVFERDGFKCVYCGRNPVDDGVTLHVDHVIPRSKGGLDIMSNLVTSCSDCNLAKNDKVIDIPKYLQEYLHQSRS